jgi:serine/threonine-protein kinase
MGVVVAARHTQLDTRMALKFLLPAMLDKPEAVKRFARESRAASKITNEHVARVFDVGTLENGAPFMVMEFLEGEDLSAWVEQRGALPVDLAVDFVLQACVAVADAHGLGIVHRDLKPANLFCIRRSDGRFLIKVLDFGISKVTDFGVGGTSGAATQTSALMGSPNYMSPEQMRSAKDVDARTDIWALGITLFELLTARTPFSGETFGEILIALATLPPPPIREIRPDVTEALERVVLKCLEKDRDQRYANVADLSLALLPFGSRHARNSVEQISGIIQGAGLSASALVLPTSSRDPRAPSPAPAARPNSLAEGHPLETAAAWSELPGVSSSRRTAVGVVASLGVLAMTGLLALLLWRPWARTPSADASPSPSVAVALPPASPVAQTSGEPQELVPLRPSAAAPSLPTPPVDAGVAKVVDRAFLPPGQGAPPPVPQVPRPASPPPASPRAPATPECKVPYFFDDSGNKRFKKECL